MKINGSCHCGNIRYQADGEFGDLLSCNCSICSKRGSLLWFIPRSNLSVSTPDKPLSTYTFNSHKIKHHFCPVCGCAPFGEGEDGKGNSMAAINARCVDNVDLSQFKINHFDGKSL
ncbi:GFA family protein [Neptunicella marina]|uniref:GFA family protein n=1 Tax=Neptunicella marina TaxID=2125989 RepID=A0A8J6LVK5_9ALTE|nr:GFA family protein [Neptunicella marina]MBC3764649.1 GFA family protein [Neptunicella marina]